MDIKDITYPGISMEEFEQNMKKFAEQLADTDNRLKELEKALLQVEVMKKDSVGASQAEIESRIDTFLDEIGPLIFKNEPDKQ